MLRMKDLIKHFIVKALSSAPVSKVGERLYGHHVPIFMLHRFACKDLGIEGHDLSLLKYALEFMRSREANFVSVEDVALAVKNQTSLPPKSVAFSIDDGYWDHVEIPAQLFVDYDCPTTYFVTTGFVNKELWFWDAKVEYILDETNPQKYGVIESLFPGLALEGVSLAEAREKIVFSLAELPMEKIEQRLVELAEHLEVEIPTVAPEKFQSTTWEKLRDIEKKGMRIAAHSYSHPLLSKESDENCFNEIKKSREDIISHVESPSNIFCYPVGRHQDFGTREQDYCRQLGFDGAVSALPPVVDLNEAENLFRLPRFAFPDTRADVIQYSTWIESFKNQVRN